MSSCAGYHTPIEDEVVVDGECDVLSELGPLTPRGDSIVTNQVITFELCTLFFKLRHRLKYELNKNCRRHHLVQLL